MRALKPIVIAAVVALTAPAAVADPFTLKDKAIGKLTAESPPSDDDRLVPGWRAGRLHLGMTTAQLLAVMGEPDQTFAYGYHYAWGGIYVQTLKDGKVTSIGVGWNNRSSPMKTAEGVGIGSSQIAVVAALGQPESRTLSMGTLYFCYERGLVVQFDGGTTASQISIVTKARAKWVCADK